MATFSQWAKGKKVSRVAWLCGPEYALSLAIRREYDTLAVPDRTVIWASSGIGVWETVLTVSPGPRLIFVYHAETLRDLSLLPHLLADDFDGTYTVFVSNEDDFRKDEKALVPGLAALRDSKHGQLVRCCAPASEEDQAAIVASWWQGAGRNIGGQLLAACGGSLTDAWYACEKARATGLEPRPEAIPYVAAPLAHDEFVDLLFAGRRGDAASAARNLPPEAAGPVIGLLASRIGLLPLVREAVQKRETPQDTVRRLRVDAWVLRQIRPHAMDYAPDRVARCRELLAIAETAWKSGARTGVLEAVAALW